MWNESDGGREGGVHDERQGRSSTGSEVVMIDDRVMEAASRSTPAVSNLNISKSSRVHIGPKFVSVTQNVNNSEMLKGRILGLELISAKHTRRLRCSVAVFVCWTFIVALGLALYLFYVTLFKQQTRLDIDLKEEWYKRRDDWQAMPAYDVEFLELPLKNVVIGHTAANYCTTIYDCIKKMLSIQEDNLRRDMFDIAPNFLVGGAEGFVFEGRGANVIGAMVKSWNMKSIMIMFLGDYTINKTNQAQFDHLNVLLKVLVNMRVLHPDYVIFGHCQISPQIISPGPHIMQNMNNFSHWNPVNTTQCLR